MRSNREKLTAKAYKTFQEDLGITRAQLEALKWLHNRGSSGVFEKNKQVLVAQGERAPIERRTWNALHEANIIEINGRVTIKERFLHILNTYKSVWELIGESPDDNDINYVGDEDE